MNPVEGMGTTKLTSKEALLGAGVLKTRVLELDSVPGASIILREITGADRHALMTTYFTRRGNEMELNDGATRDFQPDLIARSAVDEEGELIFSQDDLEALCALPARMLDEIADDAMELSGFKDEDGAGNE